MPPQPIVDVAQYDFTRPRYSRADLEKVIPHRGEMALIDGLVHVDPERRLLVGYMDVRGDAFWCAGHFPGNPIQPGVVMIEAAGQLAVIGYKLLVPEVKNRLVVFGGVDDVRFRGVIRPGSRVVVVARGDELSKRLAKCQTQGIVDGKVVYEGIILGIPT